VTSSAVVELQELSTILQELKVSILLSVEKFQLQCSKRYLICLRRRLVKKNRKTKKRKWIELKLTYKTQIVKVTVKVQIMAIMLLW